MLPAIETVTSNSTYSIDNLVRLVRETGNSPVRQLALRMLQPPKGKFRPLHVLRDETNQGE